MHLSGIQTRYNGMQRKGDAQGSRCMGCTKGTSPGQHQVPRVMTPISRAAHMRTRTLDVPEYTERATTWLPWATNLAGCVCQ